MTDHFGGLRLLIVIAAVFSAGSNWLAAADAVYNGKPVAEWIELTAHEDENVRRQAAYALGRIGPAASEAVEALTTAVDDVKQEVRWYAVAALGGVGPAAAPAVPTIVEGIKHPANDRTFARNGVKTLGLIGPDAKEALPLLSEALRDADPTYRVAAALAVWRITKRPEAIDRLAQELAEPTGAGAYEACMALGELGSEARRAGGALVTALGHPSPDVRRAAAKVLGGLGPAMVPAIVGGLEQGGAGHAAAAVALGYIAEEVREKVYYNPSATAKHLELADQFALGEIVPAMVPLLGHSEADITRAAARCLAKVGPHAVAALLEALADDDPAMRENAADALARLEKHLPREGAVTAAVEDFKRARITPPLIQALGNSDPQVRWPALRLFAALSIGPYGQDAAPVLRQALKNDDPMIRRYAAKSLERLRQGVE